jgi:hypothetical protein
MPVRSAWRPDTQQSYSARTNLCEHGLHSARTLFGTVTLYGFRAGTLSGWDSPLVPMLCSIAESRDDLAALQGSAAKALGQSSSYVTKGHGSSKSRCPEILRSR